MVCSRNSNVFLIPARAKVDNKMDLKDKCLSHIRVLEYLRNLPDATARDAHPLKEVKFVLILDMCWVPGKFEFAITDTISELDEKKAPGYWSMFYSTSRGSVAEDGEQGSHSPMALGLLDPQSGIFAPGVSLEQGIKNACESVEKMSSVDMRQRPIKINIDCLGNVILQEQPLEVIEGAGYADTATSQYEIVAYLKRRGLDSIAERVSEELGLEEIEDLRYVKTGGLDKLEWLKDVQKAKMLKLCREVTARLMSADDSDRCSADDTSSQGASTPLPRSVGSPDGMGFESDGEDVLIAARNVGDCAEFQEHMRRFIQDFQQWKWLVEMNLKQETYDIALAVHLLRCRQQQVDHLHALLDLFRTEHRCNA